MTREWQTARGSLAFHRIMSVPSYRPPTSRTSAGNLAPCLRCTVRDQQMPQVRWQRLNINDERQHVKPPGGASSSRHDHFGTNHSQLMGPDQAVMVGPNGAVVATKALVAARYQRHLHRHRQRHPSCGKLGSQAGVELAHLLIPLTEG